MNTVKPSVRKCSQSGFGLIEMAMVVAIGAIIVSMSVIVFGRAAARYQLNQKAQNIAWQIERARSLAIKYNQTLKLGFTSQNRAFGFTCTDCAEAKSELPVITIPNDITLSAYPTITIKGNGTIAVTNGSATTTNGAITVGDSKGRQVQITISNAGRAVVGAVVDAGTAH